MTPAHPTRRRNRSEEGAVAVLAGILAVVLLGIAALAVDLGNMMDRKQRTQTQADTAALAGGGELPAPSTVPTSADPEVLAVARYMIRNDVFDDGTSSFELASMTEAALAQKLVSTAPADMATYGHVYYGRFVDGALEPSKNYITVTSPQRTVQFGLATVLGQDTADVTSEATVGIFSDGSFGALPFYAYSGCDWGQQTISHDTSNPTAPTLYSSGDWTTEGGSGKPALTAPTSTTPNASPQRIDVGASTVITLSGTNLQKWDGSASGLGVTAVGFFLPDGSAPVTVPKEQLTVDASGTQITLPSTVGTQSAVDGKTFYLRVQYRTKQGNNYVLRGSTVAATMAYLEVGSATLFCNDSKSSGNFGSVTVYRADSNNSANSGWLPLNIAQGTHTPFVYLNKYTDPVTSTSCSNSDPADWQSDVESTNIRCLVTDTGFPQNPASAGLVQGIGTVKGRLANTDSGCGGSVPGKPPIRSVQVHGTFQINNEVLSCYLTNTTTTLSQISSSSYPGPVVFSPDIYSSPRFFYVPVVSKAPSNGKKSYPIIDFRPAFLTGEGPATTKGASVYLTGDDATTNGLTIDKNAVESFRLSFINLNALPPPPGSGVLTEYTGSGTKRLILVD